ncbi:hypothetical protein JXJ21_16845 [candidate division KSB1 bacterium]|nr:hypothetical protein [candidate division KSB1 bacterium]
MIWEIIWKFILLFTLSVYSILVVIVFFGGIKNIREMFIDLKSQSQGQK